MPVLPGGKVPPKTIPESVLVPVPLLSFLAAGKFVDAELTVSKTIEALATRAAKKLGYKNGKINSSS